MVLFQKSKSKAQLSIQITSNIEMNVELKSKVRIHERSWISQVSLEAWAETSKMPGRKKLSAS